MPDAVLVPGLGFDVNGGRLGRGGGFYDRLLAAGTACRVGVAFECQVVEALPLEPHDRRMEFIITEQRVLAPGRTCRQEGAA
jgi:5-formyltetrahydrofolate cyclo-ligase